MPGLDARVAEGALLGLAGLPVEVDLLVGAVRRRTCASPGRPPGRPGRCRPPRACTSRPEGHEATHDGLRQCSQMRGRYIMKTRSYSIRTASSTPREVGVGGRVLGRPGEVVLPVGPPLDRHRLAGDGRQRPRDRLVLGRRRAGQRVVVEGERLVVVVERRQVGVEEDVEQAPASATPLFSSQAALAVELPAAVPGLLVLPALGVADAGLGLDVVEPHVLGAVAVGPDVLAGDAAGVAADALVEVHHHADLGPDAHQYATSDWRRRMTVSSSRWEPVGP